MDERLIPTSIRVLARFEDLIPNNPHRRVQIDEIDGRQRVTILKRRNRIACGFEKDGDAMRLLHTSPDDLSAVADDLRYMGIAPEMLADASQDDEADVVDLAALRAATAYPFPDDPNAEVCVVTGGRAYARRVSNPSYVHGWYGSTVADGGHFFAVVDESLPVGPLCDDEISKAIESGRLVPDIPMDRETLAGLPSAAVEALLVLGMERAEEQFARGVSGELPIGIRSEDDDYLATPFMDGLMGRSSEGRIDVEGIGRLMALLARARGMPYEPDEHRASVVARTAKRLAADPMADFEVMMAPTP